MTALCVVFCIAYCKESATIQDCHHHYAVWLSKQEVRPLNCTLLCLVRICWQRLQISNFKGTQSMTEFCHYVYIVFAGKMWELLYLDRSLHLSCKCLMKFVYQISCSTWNFMSTPNLKFVWSDSVVCEWSHWAFLLCKLYLWYAFSTIFITFLTLETMILWLNLCIYNVTLIMCAILAQSILYFYVCECVFVSKEAVWMYAHSSNFVLYSSPYNRPRRPRGGVEV